MGDLLPGDLQLALGDGELLLRPGDLVLDLREVVARRRELLGPVLGGALRLGLHAEQLTRHAERLAEALGDLRRRLQRAADLVPTDLEAEDERARP